MKPWRTLARSVALAHSAYLTVENHTIELPDGRTIENWPWIITPAFVNIAAIDQQGRFLCFRQTKYAVAETTLAPVGGYLEPGEDALATARRELLEETGYQAPEWTDLGEYAVDGNRGSGVAHLFLARGAQQVGNPYADDLEDQELLLLSRAELTAALADGEFKVLPWVAVMALALLYTA